MESRRGAACRGYAIDAVTNRGYALSQEKRLVVAPRYRAVPAGQPRFRRHRAQTRWTPRTPKRAAARSKARPKAPSSSPRSRSPAKDGLERRSSLLPPPACTSASCCAPRWPPTTADFIIRRRSRGVRAGYRAGDGRRVTDQVGKRHLLRRPKVAGILTEGVVDMESGRFEHAVLGIGVNVKPPTDGFPHDIADVAGAVLGDHTGAIRCELAAAILARFWTSTDAWRIRRCTTNTAAVASCWGSRWSYVRSFARTSPRRRSHARLQAGHRVARQIPPRAPLRRGDHRLRRHPPRASRSLKQSTPQARSATHPENRFARELGAAANAAAPIITQPAPLE